MSKWRNSSDGKILTRSGALGVLAALVASGLPIGDDLRKHGNYHVRRAVWVSENMPIPDAPLVEGKGYDSSARVELFKSLMPNHFARVVAQKGKDASHQKRNAATIAAAEEHNAKAGLLRAAEQEKFDVLVAWLPIVQREARSLPASAPQSKYNEFAAPCAEVDGWIRERCEVYVPEVFQPIDATDFAAWQSVVGDSIYAHLFVSDPGVIDAIPTPS